MAFQRYVRSYWKHILTNPEGKTGGWDIDNDWDAFTMLNGMSKFTIKS